MAYPPNENVYTQTFTPKEFQVDLLESARSENTIVCCNTSAAKTFIVVKLVQELSLQWKADGLEPKAVFLFNEANLAVMALQLQYMTNITCDVIPNDWKLEDVQKTLEDRDVILTTAEIFDELIISLQLDLTHFRLIVIDDCLYGEHQQLLSSNLMRLYNNLQSIRPRILGLVSGLLTADMQPVYLESEMRRLERLLCSRVDTSSELVTLVRHSSRPREALLECACNTPTDDGVSKRVREITLDAKDFLTEHRYDLATMYGDEFMDELKAVPDPTETPIKLIEQFLAVLDDMGLWAADQAALRMLDVLERLKVKVPFERHFILLRMLTTVMVMVRALCDSAFCDMDELEKIIRFSSPKVLKLLEIIKEFRPADCEKAPIVPAGTSIGTNDITSVAVTTTTVTHANRGGKRNIRAFRRSNLRPQNEDSLCALIFVDDQYTAKVLFSLLAIMSRVDNNYWWVAPQYVLNKVSDPTLDCKEAEQEHVNQEESLRKFRAHECNIMIATSVIEQGCDLPRCNLVIRFDLPATFHSYVQSKARARAPDAHYLVLADEHRMIVYINKQLAQYLAVESNLLQRCQSLEPSECEKSIADEYSSRCEPYRTSDVPDTPSVSLSTAIALVNRYCAKLPSDTFTRLTPLWTIKETGDGFVCVLRLPINSPVKQTVCTPPMVNQLLARRVAAFFICQLLHKAGELDDNLLPVGKENFRASEEGSDCQLDSDDEQLVKDNVSEQRPGTTKRRQYYYKCIAEPLADCAPKSRANAVYFYRIIMTLTCPLPEEQNTRGRRIYPPEESPQGFGILTAKKLPIICDFPIFTRSGEVSVKFKLCEVLTDLSSEQIVLINNFVKYTFDNVLRLQKYMMDFDPVSAPSAYMIVPTYTNGQEEESPGASYIDWGFMNVIYVSEGRKPNIVPDEDRNGFYFDPGQYKDAVVMPWYRNQDQPQYFYVAEICTHLNPTAEFPGFSYATFEEYYLLKYNIQIQNKEQYLLDVDHTSARLNFLTPRYVNRKGVALPTSSEETKRAKRENLEQKQILIPELCDIHPFPASLWRKAVCLPCILYRMNALLLADQVRMTVAIEMGLGTVELEQGFEWPALNFGWSLSDVLQRFKAQEHKVFASNPLDAKSPSKSRKQPVEKRDSNTNSDSSFEEIKRCSSQDVGWVEIGTWSNEMATTAGDTADSTVRYSTPTGWAKQGFEYTSCSGDESFASSADEDGDNYDDFDDDDDEDDYSSDYDSNNDGAVGKKNPSGLHIEFKEGNVAEAVDNRNGDEDGENHQLQQHYTWEDFQDGGERADPALVEEFEQSVRAFSVRIRNETNGGWLIEKGKKYTRASNTVKSLSSDESSIHNHQPKLLCPALNKKSSACIVDKKRDQLVEFPDDDDIVKQIKFSFDLQPNLDEHPGPSPSFILQALTMSNANDGINLERLETIGDSFLKYAITDYLYTKYEHVHEGKLSHLRSKQVSNLNLYRLGKRKRLGEKMIATKFDPHDNWLPPCYHVPKAKEIVPKEATDTIADSDDDDDDDDDLPPPTEAERLATRSTLKYLEQLLNKITIDCKSSPLAASVPYNLVTQHSIPDKSIADCVEALIGAYLIECGPRGALLFMAWLGIKVLPPSEGPIKYGDLPSSPSPLLRNVPDPEEELELLLDGYSRFEEAIHYRFNDRSYLLQALTHASYSPNQLTDCYQRLEFLGDAVLDYLITRHLYEDARMHSPGALTDLRSALVNNTIFASLAVRFGFHKYFKHLSPGLYEVVEKFIRQQEANGHGLMDELYLMAESECKEVEDVEVPKSLGDIFESVAGAIFLDSGRSLDAVWRVYYRMMAKEIEQFSDRVPKSPIRELLELEPETAKFGTPEKLADGRRVRVTVEVFGKGVFKGIGRNYRIAKCTAAKCALKYLKKHHGNASNAANAYKRT